MREAPGRCDATGSGPRRATWAALLLAAGCSSPEPEPEPFPFAEFAAQLSARPVPGEKAQTWEQMQAVGGLRVLDPVRLPDGTVLLPLACDVSGESTVATAPTQQNPERVVSRTESIVMGDNIQFRIVTGLPARGASVHASPLSLGRLAPGEYRVEYANPDGWRSRLRTVTIGAERAPLAVPAAKPADPLLALAPASHFRGVIVPEGIAHPFHEGRWTPTAAEAWAAECRMIETLLLATWCPDEALGEASTPQHRSFQVEEVAKIVAQLDRYALKFAGVTVNGQRRVLIEASVVDDPVAWMPTLGSSPWEIIDDGGCDYWSIQYDPASDRCIEFESHGYA